ncbi:MAG: YbaN family protein [Moraxella equi]|nr:YbaN family protein [Moraxella equi]
MSDHTDPDYTDPSHTPSSQLPKHGMHQNVLLRWAFFIMGFIFVGLGILGAILPGMPTTVFILLAGYCWAKSSRRFHGWLIRHKIFGKMLIDWEERRAMPRFAKYLAWSMMTASSAFLFWRLPADKLWVAVLTSILCLATAIWMYRLPDA